MTITSPLKSGWLSVALLLVLAWPVQPSPLMAENAKLLFASGFNKGVRLLPADPYYQVIKGKDRKTGFRWPIKIRGASNSALHPIDHDDHNAVSNQIRKVIGHNGKPTRVLYSVERYNTGVTQSPYEILNIKQGRKDLYIRYWMKLDSPSFRAKNKWRALFEYKTVGYGKGDGFRLISYVYTDRKGRAYWHWQGDANPQKTIWEIDNHNIPVPRNKWFLTEYFWRWSERDDGVAWWKINGKLVGKHRGPTTRNGKKINFIMPFQIYGNSNPKHQWVDDLEIWDGVPEQSYFP